MDPGTLAAAILGPVIFILAVLLLVIVIRRICCNHGDQPAMAPNKVRKAGGFDNPLYTQSPLDNAVSMKHLMMNTSEAPAGVSYVRETAPDWAPMEGGFFGGHGLSLDLQPSGLDGMQPPGDVPVVREERSSSFSNPLFTEDSFPSLARQSSVDLFVDRSPISDMSTPTFEDGYMIVQGVTSDESTDNDNEVPENGKRKVRFSVESNVVHIPDIIHEEERYDDIQPYAGPGDHSGEESRTGAIQIAEYSQVNKPKSLDIPFINIISATPPSGPLEDDEGYMIPKNVEKPMDKSDESICELEHVDLSTSSGVNNDIPEPIYAQIEESIPHKSGDYTPHTEPLSIDVTGMNVSDNMGESSSDSIVKIDFSPSLESYREGHETGLINPLYHHSGSGIVMQSSPLEASRNSSSDDVIVLDSPQDSGTSNSWEMIPDFQLNPSNDLQKQDSEETPLDKSFDDIMSKAWDLANWADNSNSNTPKKDKSKKSKKGFDNPMFADHPISKEIIKSEIDVHVKPKDKFANDSEDSDISESVNGMVTMSHFQLGDSQC